MYEYLLENLINYSQVEGNLRRTADRGLISNLYRKQMNALALKYFGVDKNGNYTENKEDIVSYRCPYSGEVINDLSTAHLEHILPVSSNGGTILFNCIPVIYKVNLSKRDEPNLLSWWQEQDYFSYDRLERLVKYMLEAYNLSFKEPTEEEIYDYEDSSNTEDYIEKDDLSLDLRSKSKKINKSNQNITYYQLLTDMINELSKNRDVSKYNTKLNSLKEQNIFGNINEIEKVIKAVQTVFEEALGEDSKRYLSYSLKIDMNKLYQSLKTNNYEQEIRERLNYIKEIIDGNNKSLNDYFDDLQDIEEYNILYFSNPTNEMIEMFLSNIRLGNEGKIKAFINMLKIVQTEKEISKILKAGSNEKFKTYRQNEDGNWIVDKEYNEIGHFWSTNKDKIIPIINQDEELKNKLDNYYMNTLSGQQSEEGKNRRIDIFVNMLKVAQTEKEISKLLKSGTTEKFKTYKQNENGDLIIDKEYNEIGQFWSANKDKIIPIINQDEELKNKLDNYYMNTRSGQLSEEGKNRRIHIFADMLKMAQTEEEIYQLLKNGSNEKLKTYTQTEDGAWIINKEYEEIKSFWNSSNNKYKIMPIINQDEELRNKLDNYYMNTFSGQNSEQGKNRRIDIFVNMLKVAQTEEEISQLLKKRGTEKFKTYKQNKDGELIIDKEYNEIGAFWIRNKDKIIPIINQDEELKNKLDNYYMNTLSGQSSEEGINRRIDIFVNMLKVAQTEEEISKLLKQRGTEKFKTYKQNENGNLIIDKEYNEIGQFWSANKDKIIPIINQDEELKNKLDNYYMNTIGGQNSEEGKNRRIDIFVNMLKIAQTEEEISKLLKKRGTEKFKTYKQNKDGDLIIDKEYNEIGQFWSNNKDRIITIINQDKELRNKLDNYYMNTRSGQLSEEGINRRTDIFINMLKMAQTEEEISKILKAGSNEKFKTYRQNEDGDLIIDKEYNEIGGFWISNKDKIIPIINQDEELKNKLDNYYMNTIGGQNSEEGKNRRIDIFVNMLKIAQTEEEIFKILKRGTNERFKTYKQNKDGDLIIDKEYNEIGVFWNNNKDKKIIPQLFFSEEYASQEFNSARKNVINYLNSLRRKKKQPEFKTIDEYIDTLDKTKKETKVLIELRDNLLKRKQKLIIENKELTEELNTSVRRAM